MKNPSIGAISHSGAHIKKAIRWPKWLLRNLSISDILQRLLKDTPHRGR
jgi:hypothetical protein